MGLTSSSTGANLLADDFNLLKHNTDFTVTLAGNPNVRKVNCF